MILDIVTLVVLNLMHGLQLEVTSDDVLHLWLQLRLPITTLQQYQEYYLINYSLILTLIIIIDYL